MESVGFKEWALVCEALGRGCQSIILRKGGIAEGRDGFSFKHREFFLFPTWFHEQPEKVRAMWHGLPSPWFELDPRFIGKMPMPQEGMIQISYVARLEISQTITSWKVAEALAPLHILQSEVVRERFEYDEAPGLQVALVRVFKLDPIWTFPDEEKYGGCRSWIELPEPPNDLKLNPVLSEAEHTERLNEFLATVDPVEAL
jgi:hypothetical protein